MKNRSFCWFIILPVFATLADHDRFTVNYLKYTDNFKLENEICWTGTINKKIPIFLHYSVYDNLIVGEIVYLNTAKRIPIKIIGTIEENKSYRLLEFEPDGNISGIISGIPGKNEFIGDWFSPKTRKELPLTLVKKDNTIKVTKLIPNTTSIPGSYHYQYSEEGYIGDVEIDSLDSKKYMFNIFSVTGAPGRNIAEVPNDIVEIKGNNFSYMIPDSDSCEFKVSFYNDFLVIDYTKGYCKSQFGWNATVDGIFLKVKRRKNKQEEN